jgi:hypothetical protein
MLYRGKTIVIPNHITLAREGEYGRTWYEESAESVKIYADAKGYTVKRVADILAITSPRVSVKHNITLATRYLEEGTTQGMMLGRIRALQRYDRTGEFSGPKVTAFSRALQGDTSVVVVDTWMLKAFQEEKPTPKVHRHISKTVKMLATKLEWKPTETQAAIWVAIRSRCGFKNASKLLMPELT